MLTVFNEYFSSISDHRQQSKVDHKLNDILLTLAVGVICGADGWESIEEVAHKKIEILRNMALLRMAFAYTTPSLKTQRNEITAITALLDLLYIKGSIFTIDAMGCQKEIAKKIRNKEADYVIAVKGNQGDLHRSNAAVNMSVIRHLVLNLLKLERSCKKGLKAKRFKAALDTDYAKEVLQLVY